MKSSATDTHKASVEAEPTSAPRTHPALHKLRSQTPRLATFSGSGGGHRGPPPQVPAAPVKGPLSPRLPNPLVWSPTLALWLHVQPLRCPSRACVHSGSCCRQFTPCLGAAGKGVADGTGGHGGGLWVRKVVAGVMLPTPSGRCPTHEEAVATGDSLQQRHHTGHRRGDA